ncbi:MAG: type II toxin-antitoxin system VapC family toxin [Solirubrobacterales bacterium]
MLVDTHALLWFLAADPRLSDRARETIEDAKVIPFVSVASTLEIAIKASLGRLAVPDDLPEQLAGQGFVSAPVEAEHAWRVRALDGEDHKDPFDRLIAAQALVEGLPVVSADPAFDRYGVRRKW